MTIFLLFLNLAVPIVYSMHSCVYNKHIKVNHILTFSVGYVFYWILPFILYYAKIFFNDNYYIEIMKMFNDAGTIKIRKFLMFSFLIYCSFILGNTFEIIKKKLHKKKIQFTISLNIFLFLFLCTIFIICVILNREILFGGYSDLDNRQYAGMFSALVMILCDSLLLHILYNIKVVNIINIVKSTWCILFFITSALILTTGGRLYVASSILALICMYSTNYRPLSIIRLFELVVISIIIMGAIGVFRAEDTQNTVKILNKIVFNIVAEPVFTSYSLGKYLKNYSLVFFNIPISLFSSFFNLIPSILLPNKSSYIITYADLGYEISAPLGALSSFVSFNIEFGILGTMLFILLFSNYLKKLSCKTDNLHMAIYAMISGQLMFTLFRDPFSVSLIKNIFEFSIIFPLIMDIFYKNYSLKLNEIKSDILR